MLKPPTKYASVWLICFIIWTHFEATPKYLKASNMSIEYYQEKIVNGYRCNIRQYPYMVSLQYTENYRHHCGGTLISKFWILTAGHCCLKNYELGMLSAVAGEAYIARKKAKRFLIARNYRYCENRYNDIGLMELDFPIEDIDYVKLPNFKNKYKPIEVICKKGIAIGWGDQYCKDNSCQPVTQPVPPHDPHIQCVELPIINNTECGYRLNFKIPPTIICAYAKNKGACQKDSGGPLICDGIQYGIISSGEGCAYKNYPDIFMRVDMFENFIRVVTLRSKTVSYRANSLIIIIIILLLLI